jgi:hypothetical protein
MIIYLAGLQAIPDELYDAAKVDGAGPVRMLFSITIPLLGPATFFLLITSIIGAFQEFGRRGLTRVLVEGGSVLAAGLVRAGLVDRVVWVHAPLVIGGDGVPALAALGLERLADAPSFVRGGVEIVGDDVLETLVRRA